MSLLSVAGSTPSEGFELKSLRFNRPSNSILSRTPTVTTDRQKWTLSVWSKRGGIDGTIAGLQTIFGTQESTAAGGTGEELIRIAWNATDQLSIHSDTDASFNVITTPVYRDPCSWYHVVIACDTTQATDTNRLKFYVNGTQITAFATTNWPALDLLTCFNYAHAHRIGASHGATAEVLDGYLSEFYWIDGQQLTPSSFGATDEDTNQWLPTDPTDLKETLTFGTNGFYLPFSNDVWNKEFADSYLPTTFSPTETLSCDVLVVAGGGGGGGLSPGGGGGAGSIEVNASFSVTAGDHTITVGAGGAGTVAGPVASQNGTNSTFSTITAYGGGAGGDDDADRPSSGGSGGGGNSAPHPGAVAGSGSNVYTGGAGSSNPYSGGGGGGASAVGLDGNTGGGGGDGGDGISQ